MNTSNPELPVSHRVSIVVPMYNEIGNVQPLVERVFETMQSAPWPWELILVDDGSRDGTGDALRRMAQAHPDFVHVVQLSRNFKQTAAMQAGIDAARGDVIVTMDGDLQNDPVDIERMVERLIREDLDLVAGWRKDRKDALLLRKFPSRIANRLIARMTGIVLNDYGCSLKVYRASTLRRVRLYGEMHRFIPAWLATVTSDQRIAQEVVTHHPRVHGESKYGISRTFRVLLDLFFVYFFMRFRSRPGHFFGGIGLFLMGIGGLVLSYLFALKLAFGEDIGTRPLLFVGFFMAIAGVQMLTSGILAEVLVRVMFESGHNKSYLVHDPRQMSDDMGWYRSGQTGNGA
jgi:glycosyltransferase involved in cell wall biosynthesis